MIDYPDENLEMRFTHEWRMIKLRHEMLNPAILLLARINAD